MDTIDTISPYPESKIAVDLKGSGIDINELKDGKAADFEIDANPFEPIAEEENTYFDKEGLFKQLNYECLDDGCEDEHSTPFSRMRTEMLDLTNDGGVMKKILKHGAGAIIPKNSLCRVHYNAYLEYSDEPFDSSRLRGRQKQFKLGLGEVLAGWEIGLLTMKRGELARFMFSHSYAFGKMGCPPRIPAEASVLFEIELISFVDQGDADEFDNFSEEERKQASFDQILKVVDSLRMTGNESFQIHQVGRAAGKYSQALRLLENANLKNEEEESLMKKSCLKLCLNLSLCDLNQSKSGRACKYARKALDIEPRNIKALYRLARALRQLGEYDDAKKQISKAHRLDPRNKDITEELHKLDEEMRKYRKSNQDLSRRMLNIDLAPKIPEKAKPVAAPSQMVDLINNMLKTFVDNNEQPVLKLPVNLTAAEIVSIKKSASNMNLYFNECKGSSQSAKSYYVSKVPEN